MKSLRYRFLSKISAHESGCWLWTGAIVGKSKTASGGYGRLYSGEKTHWEYAHRIAWILFKGPIPDQLCVLHKCDVRNCVNPEHLFLGTKADNAADMDAKGRRVNAPHYGEDHPHAKLTWAKVRAIRAVKGKLHDRGNSLLERLAKKYGVTATNISYIRRGKTWIDAR